MDIKKVSFKQFLQLDESVLLEVEKKKKKILKPKPRPKKILWFHGDKQNWHNDLQFAHGGKFQYYVSTEEEESDRNYYAIDHQHQNACYGVWQGKQNRGVTFHTPKPLHAVKHPRLLIKPFQHSNVTASNIAKK